MPTSLNLSSQATELDCLEQVLGLKARIQMKKISCSSNLLLHSSAQGLKAFVQNYKVWHD